MKDLKREIRLAIAVKLLFWAVCILPKDKIEAIRQIAEANKKI